MTDIRRPQATPVFIPIDRLLIFDSFRFLAHQHERMWPALEAVRVFRDDKWLILVEGFMRIEDLKLQGQSSVLATISDGTVTAGLKAVLSIFRSGKNSRDDKRKAMRTIHDHTPWKNLSSRALAKETGISSYLISDYRTKFDSSTQRVVRSDGRMCHRDKASVQEMRKEIRRAIKAGKTTAMIGRTMGCDYRTVMSVRRELLNAQMQHVASDASQAETGGSITWAIRGPQGPNAAGPLEPGAT